MKIDEKLRKECHQQALQRTKNPIAVKNWTMELYNRKMQQRFDKINTNKRRKM